MIKNLDDLTLRLHFLQTSRFTRNSRTKIYSYVFLLFLFDEPEVF